jgi:hypothetical protein
METLKTAEKEMLSERLLSNILQNQSQALVVKSKLQSQGQALVIRKKQK